MLSNHEDYLHDSHGVNPNIFRTVGNNIQKEIQQANNLLPDIKVSFNITDAEITNRDSFNKNTIQEDKMNTQASNQRIKFIFRPAPQDSYYPQNDSNSNSNYNANGHPSQSQFQQHQEDQINKLSAQIDISKQIIKMIKNEIEEQNQIILNLDENIDNAHTAMRKVTDQITLIIDNEGKMPIYLVAILSLILILMIFIVA